MPRAIWWDYKHEHDEIYTLNPTAEIAGYFYFMGTGIYRRYANNLMDKIYSYLLHDDNCCSDMHEILCLMRMTRMLPGKKQLSLLDFFVLD